MIAPRGWKGIVDDLLGQIDEALPVGWTIEVEEVKAKYGSLRFYYQLHGPADAAMRRLINARLDALVQAAEDRSEVTCHLCGAPIARPSPAPGEFGRRVTVCESCRVAYDMHGMRMP